MEKSINIPVNCRCLVCDPAGVNSARRTIFLDRDGVINENLDNDYVKRWEEFRFLMKAKDAIKALTNAKWDIIIVSNQAGIGKGIMSAEAVEKINIRMIDEIGRCGGKIKAVYYCPHKADENCECRKPKSGMLLRAADDFGINLPDSYLIGDNITDIQAGLHAGCTTILVETNRGKEYLDKQDRLNVIPDYTAPDIFEAVKIVLSLAGH